MEVWNQGLRSLCRFVMGSYQEELLEVCMGAPATTRMSSKGQVVIRDSIRKQLNLKAGAEFVVMGEEDVGIVKAIAMPDINEIDAQDIEGSEDVTWNGEST